MSHQCVPSWDLDDTLNSSRFTTLPPNLSTLDYEVAELTWVNGQLAMHGLGPPRVLAKPFPAAKYAAMWDKPSVGDTLESIVNQATTTTTLPLPLPPTQPQQKLPLTATTAAAANADALPCWFDHYHLRPTSAAHPSLAMDALVPSSSLNDSTSRHVPDPTSAEMRITTPSTTIGVGSGGGGSSTHVGSCSGTGAIGRRSRREERVARVPTGLSGESASASATFGLTANTLDLETGFGSTSTQENTTAGIPSPSYTKHTTVDDRDSVAHSRSHQKREEGFEFDEDKKQSQSGKSSVSTKRSRAAAIHNQSERKRRDKINQKMKTLQKLVPNSSKTDKASMLDEVIEYIKQLQAQVQMMNRLNMPHMMMPLTLQQQLHMSLMARMSMGMGMGMGLMDMNPIGHRNITAIPPILNPATFMPMTSWDATGDHRLQPPSAAVMPDPLSTFLACQTQVHLVARLSSRYLVTSSELPSETTSTFTTLLALAPTDVIFQMTVEAKLTREYEEFGPRRFHGKPDLIEAERFIKSHEKIQRLLRIDDSRKPELASFSL
ncbi:hypothetical protein Scep_007030 [Stephania cephalantha]|uniref:BHLH domain-containing protein n=1 Tax=Stephania cephalantha TaxID=152367 RepID=A0AAP0K8Z5_9MAGN